jgi:amino acid adenylation domain-containing protein
MQEQVSNPNSTTSLANISEAKRDLLQKYLQGGFDQSADSVRSIARRPANTPPRLSLSQERLWFLDQFMPGSPVFNVPVAIRLSREINPETLAQSVNEIVRRHEVFRTTFDTIDGRPAPVISTHLEVELKVIDLTSYDEHEREAEARRVTNQEALQPFDLKRGPLLRTSLIRLTREESIFLLTMHHIVSDGWSIVLVFKELTKLYQAFSQGQTAPLEDLPIQYADYAEWQRDWLQGDVLEQQLSYWKQQLGGELPVLEMPTDRPRPAVQTHPGGRVSVSLSEQLTRDLTELGKREGATMFMTLLATFNTLLYRYSGQEDIIVGSPMANRPRAETEDLIGFFLNNLALRADLSGDPTFRELLARVRQTALDAFANQDVPFEKLIEELKPDRHLSRTAIFQVYFNLFSFSDQIDLPDGHTISFVDAWLHSDENLSKFDLTLYAGAGDKEIKLALVYNTDLFTHDRMAEMLDQLQHLLSQIVAAPAQRLSQFSLITPRAERLLPNPTQPFPARQTNAIQTLFSEQARRRPDQMAVVDPRENWSYQDLDARSNQLANYLRNSGIRKGDIVAIYGHRSAPLVWAILGVLKAGAAFVILDPAYPTSRLTELVRIAAPRAWLQIAAAGPLPDALAEFVAELNCCCRLSLPARPDANVGDLLEKYSTENPNVEIDPDDLAYVAFTSGSTGQPKGVLGRHGPLTLFASWAAEKFGLDEKDRFCMLSGLAHDPLHRDIFTPLQLGGIVSIPEPADLESPSRLIAWMKEQSITVANLTPAMSQMLSEGDTGDRIESLRYSFLVGDVLTRRDVARLQKLAPSITCVNLYGSTETQRAVSHFLVPHQNSLASDTEAKEKEALPLGKGINDVQLLVLNSSRRLCGIGEAGEIYFRSPHLARGYLGDDALTGERFIPNPFTNAVGDRLYRTGDLGGFLPDGNVEHLGRADRQVKIRGFRIEPAEIEAVLTRHPRVREAVVIACQNALGEKYLAAYMVTIPSAAITTNDLRQHLSEALPAYSIPASFVMMEALPLTPNGKLDRRALPAPDRTNREDSQQYTAPRSPIEETLVEIWKEVLAVPQVGVHDNFFALGGHSMMAVRLFAIMEKKFRKRLPLATLFQSPTVAQLGTMLEKDVAPSWSSLVPIQPHGSRPPFFCVHAVGGNVLEYYDLARHLGDDQPFYAFQSVGLDGKRRPHTRIEQMAAHYVKEICEFQPLGPYLIGGRSLGGIIAFEMACQLKAQGREVGLLALLDSYPVGYNKLSPDSGSLKNRVARNMRKMRSHLSNLRELSFGKKSRYVIDKAWFATLKLKSKLWRTVYRAYQSVGQPLPHVLRNVQEFNWLAAHSYVPQHYQGSVTLFWASADLRSTYDLVGGWCKLAEQQIEVHEIPGTHLDIIKEPHVHDLAKKLGACLDRAVPKNS